jgi:6-phosphofructokinase 1
VRKVTKNIERKTGIPARASSLGYIQRGGAPSARSRIIGSLFGSCAVNLIRSNENNRLVVLKNGKVTHISLEAAIAREKQINEELHTLARHLAI